MATVCDISSYVKHFLFMISHQPNVVLALDRSFGPPKNFVTPPWAARENIAISRKYFLEHFPVKINP